VPSGGRQPGPAGKALVKHNHRLARSACLPALQGWRCFFQPAASAHRFQDNATTRMTDHYTTLGLSSAATLADIKKAFRQKASFWHPDKNADPNAAERFRAVQAAYDVLSDADKRQAYDDNRRRNLLDSPIDTARDIWNHYFNPLL
jgi:hypothetical protein